jgi:hypothetical protein
VQIGEDQLSRRLFSADFSGPPRASASCQFSHDRSHHLSTEFRIDAVHKSHRLTLAEGSAGPAFVYLCLKYLANGGFGEGAGAGRGRTGRLANAKELDEFLPAQLKVREGKRRVAWF